METYKSNKHYIQGRTGGKPRQLDEQQRQFVISSLQEGTPIPEILKTVKISKSTLYSYVRKESSEPVFGTR